MRTLQGRKGPRRARACTGKRRVSERVNDQSTSPSGGRQLNRRNFLFATGAAGASALATTCLAGASHETSRAPQPAKCLRLDSHVHIYDHETIKAYIEFAVEQGITHYVGIVSAFSLGRDGGFQLQER